MELLPPLMLLSLYFMPILLLVKQLVIPIRELTGMPLGEVVNKQRLDQRVQGELLTLERKDLKLASGLGNPLDLHLYLDLSMQLAELEGVLSKV
jgi:hypothetical protein